MQDSEFNIEYVAFLDAEGNLQQALPETLSDRDTLVKLYQSMVLARVFDRATINLQRTGSMGTYASCEGQEAIGVGIAQAMHADDVFVPYYRDIATQIQRDVLLEEIMLFWGGDERGSNFSQQAQDFPMCVPIATQSCHAVGIAFAMKYRKQSRAVVTTCGDGATSKGDFYEAINVAGAMHLPVVFVVNNNQWAISVPRAKQTAAKTIAQKAFAAGIPGLQVDGNDPIAVYEVVQKALQQARDSHQPTLIEAITYRLGDHTTADDASRYRDKREFEAAQQLEPLKRFKKFLKAEYNWSADDDKQVYAICDQRVKAATVVYLNTKPQKPGEFFDYMFAQPTRDLMAQKKDYLAEVKRRG